MFPTKTSLLKSDPNTLKTIVYLYTLTLIALSSEDDEGFEHMVQRIREYVSRTVALRSFRTFRTSANDLYLAIHQILSGIENNDKEYSKLKQFDEQMYIRMMFFISRGKTKNMSKNDIIRLDQQLDIKNPELRSIRRVAMNWNRQSSNSKMNMLNKLERELRKIGFRSEMLQIVKQAKKLYKQQGIQLSDDQKKDSLGKTLAWAAAGAAVGLGATLYSSKKHSK